MDLPLHPATVHFPITLLSVSYGLDTLPLVRNYIPASIDSYFPPPALCVQISYYALTLGILAGFVAVASGVAQAIQIVSKQGLYEADGKTFKPKMLTLVSHALISDFVMAYSTWVWWGREKPEGLVATAKAANTAQSIDRAALAVVMFGVLAYTGHLGANLVYKHGMGLSIGSKSKSN